MTTEDETGLNFRWHLKMRSMQSSIHGEYANSQNFCGLLRLDVAPLRQTLNCVFCICVVCHDRSEERKDVTKIRMDQLPGRASASPPRILWIRISSRISYDRAGLVLAFLFVPSETPKFVGDLCPSELPACLRP